MKKDIIEIINEKIAESKQEGFQGVEIEMNMRAYDIKKDTLLYFEKNGFDVIFDEFEKDEPPKLLISWEE